MDYFETDITNPFFAGYAMEYDEAFSRKVDNILDRCGAKLPAYQLTEELIKEGISPESLSPSDFLLLDTVFDVC